MDETAIIERILYWQAKRDRDLRVMRVLRAKLAIDLGLYGSVKA